MWHDNVWLTSTLHIENSQHVLYYGTNWETNVFFFFFFFFFFFDKKRTFINKE